MRSNRAQLLRCAACGGVPDELRITITARRRGDSHVRTRPTHPHNRRRHPGRRQPEQPDRRTARAVARPGLAALREARPFQPGAHPGTRRARQGLRSLWTAPHHRRHQPLHEGPAPCSPGRRAGASCASPPWPARAARRTPNATCGASRSRSTPKRETGIWWATTPRCSSCATPTSFRISSTRRSVTPGPICATPSPCGTSGPARPRASTRSRS